MAKKNKYVTPPHLFRRIVKLFYPHRYIIALTICLVLLGAGLSIIPPLLTRKAFDKGLFPAVGKPNFPILGVLVALMILIWVVAGAIDVWKTYLTSTVGNKVMGTLRLKLFSHLQKMELAFFTKIKTGVIQSRLQNDVGGIQQVFNNTISSLLGNTVTIIAAVVAMVLLNWQMTIVALILLPFLVIVQRKIGQIRAKIAAKTQESLSEMTAITQESLSVSGILLAKIFNGQKAEIKHYETENQNQIKLQVREQMSGEWFFTIISIFMSAIPAIIYLVAGWLIHQGASITPGTIVAFTTVQSRLLFPTLGLLQVLLELQTSSALFARIFEYLDLKPSIVQARNAKKVNEAEIGRIDFSRVFFSYPDTNSKIAALNNVSFSIKPGQFVAFVGPSGAGKTTISYLIPRLYDVTSGQVMFAGDDVRDLQLEDLIQHIGVVNQDTYLFHASVKENLQYAKPTATQKEIERAAKAANIHDMIVALPDGYDTIVGEQGYRFSGGEKQRLAIARVLLKNPPVLILDEATSALDTISERAVQKALSEVASGRTTVAIAHRLSTIREADMIFVLKDGKIIEKGTNQQLLELGGVYATLDREQAVTTK